MFALAGCGPVKITKEEQENKNSKTETEIQLVNREFIKMQSMYKILSQKYKNQLEEEKRRTLSIALYYDKKGKQHMIGALSGQQYQVEAPNEENKKRLFLHQIKKRKISKHTLEKKRENLLPKN